MIKAGLILNILYLNFFLWFLQHWHVVVNEVDRWLELVDPVGRWTHEILILCSFDYMFWLFYFQKHQCIVYVGNSMVSSAISKKLCTSAWVFQRRSKLHETKGRVEFDVTENEYLFFQIGQKNIPLLIYNIDEAIDSHVHAWNRCKMALM